MPQGQQLHDARWCRPCCSGPQPSLAGVVRTFIPAGLHGVGPVVVTPGGRRRHAARTPTPGRSQPPHHATDAHPARLDPAAGPVGHGRSRVNIARPPGHRRVRVVDVPRRRLTAATTPRCRRGQQPALRPAPRSTGLRPGRADLTPVDGPFGTTRPGHRSVRGQPRRQPGRRDDARPPCWSVRCAARLGRTPGAHAGTGLLRPAWDFAGRLWEVREHAVRRGRGARTSRTAQPTRCDVPGITGQDVSASWSRATRRDWWPSSAAPHATGSWSAGCATTSTAACVRAPVRAACRWSAGASTRIRDIGWWTSPTTIAVLDQVIRRSPGRGRGRRSTVDGSTSPGETPPIIIQGRAFGLVTSPVTTQQTSPFARPALRAALRPRPGGHQQPATVPGLRHITYAG